MLSSALEITQQLWQLQDTGYREFHRRLMPTIEPMRIIGVRTPQLRQLARQLARSPFEAEQAAVSAFLQQLPHEYYEENNLHAFLIEQLTPYEACIAALERFLPYIDNWATCDMLRPKIFSKNPEPLYRQSERWMNDNHPFTVRFGIEVRMLYFLEEAFVPEDLVQIARIESPDYYVQMMQAWYFATALAKQYDAVLPCFTNRLLPAWVHNKALQKARESNRVPAQTKAFLQSLKV